MSARTTHPACVHRLQSMVVALISACASTVLAQPTGQPPATPIPTNAAEKAPTANPTVSDKLKACAERYAKAKSYRDDGKLTQELDVGARTIANDKPFSTAFERDGRFRWQFKGSVTPGAPPNFTYTVWSADQKTYDSFWSMNGQQ